MPERKKCVFCGCVDCKITNEHAWPQWSRKLVGPAGLSTVLGFRETGQPIGTVRFSSHDDMGVRVNAICKDACNSGWMSALETAVEQILTPMIRGERTSLTPAQQTEVGRWVLKTAMVFEFTASGEPFYSFEERDALRQRQLAVTASWMAIWLSRCGGSYMSTSRGSRIVFDMTLEGRSVPMVAGVTSISLGRFLCQLLTVRVPAGFDGTLAVPEGQDWKARTVSIWPPVEEVLWPPPEDIDDSNFEVMNRRFSPPKKAVVGSSEPPHLS